jgi:hypothetical protein
MSPPSFLFTSRSVPQFHPRTPSCSDSDAVVLRQTKHGRLAFSSIPIRLGDYTFMGRPRCLGAARDPPSGHVTYDVARAAVYQVEVTLQPRNYFVKLVSGGSVIRCCRTHSHLSAVTGSKPDRRDERNYVFERQVTGNCLKHLQAF